MSNLNLFKKFHPLAPKHFQERDNAVIYKYVSSADQEDNTSLESQKNIVRHMLKKRS